MRSKRRVVVKVNSLMKKKKRLTSCSLVALSKRERWCSIVVSLEVVAWGERGSCEIFLLEGGQRWW